MSTMRYKMLDAAYIQAVKDAGFEVQASIFPTPHEQRALSDGVTIELSDFYWFQTDRRKPVGDFSKKGISLAEAETLEWTQEAPEYAAVTLELSFEGSLEVTLCGRTYTLTSSGDGKVERLGLRLYKTDPTLTIKAMATSSIKSIKANLYDCGK